MSIWGRLLGGIVGFSFGGPPMPSLGALRIPNFHPEDPKKLKIVLRINQSANSTKIIAENLNSLHEVGVNEIIIDLDWSKNFAPEKTADILLNT